MEPCHGPVCALRRGSAFLEQSGMTTGDLNVTAAELVADPSLIPGVTAAVLPNTVSVTQTCDVPPEVTMDGQGGVRRSRADRGPGDGIVGDGVDPGGADVERQLRAIVAVYLPVLAPEALEQPAAQLILMPLATVMAVPVSA